MIYSINKCTKNQLDFLKHYKEEHDNKKSIYKITIAFAGVKKYTCHVCRIYGMVWYGNVLFDIIE